jgi:ABC-type uncharacterized transport system involved in gliding motility auxiliary subunit
MLASNKSISDRLTDVFWKVGSWFLLGPGEVVQRIANADRRSLAWGTLGLAAVLMLSLNLLSSLLLRNTRVDLTSDKLFTIADGTKRVLAKIDEPISVRVYYSRRLSEVAPVFGKYFERVKAMLEQYRDISRGKVQVTFIEPEPFSDAEDRAVAAGLKGVRLNQDGETGYFGLVASNTTDNDAVVEFFALERERFLEYDLTKLINGLANPSKKVVGLISGISMEGGQNPMQPVRQPQPPWMIMEQIREFFEIRSIDQTAKSLPADIDVLMVAQPTLLSADAAYAIDQYALSGGRVLLFVDPNSETSPMGPPQMPFPMSKEVGKLLASWGLAYDESKVAGDRSLARRVQFGGRAQGGATVTEYLAWLQLDKDQINEKDPVAAGIERLQLASAGALTKLEGATTIVQPIVQTTPRAGLIDTERVRFQPNPIAISNSFQPGNNPLMLAARVGGEAKSAYPDGRPKPEAKPEDKKEEAEKTAAPAKEEPKPDAKPHVASGRVNVIVVSDADMLHDQFWVEVRDFLGQQIAVPQSHNAAFVLNALENLSGGEALAGLRGRGISERPFEKVVELRRDSELKFRQKEEALAARLKELQEKLAKIETKGGDGSGPVSVMLTEKDRQMVETFRSEMLTVRGELRSVKAALRRDIDQLDRWLKITNIAAIPLLIGIGGLAVGLMQRRRRQPQQRAG